MKKYFPLLLALAMIPALCACGSDTAASEESAVETAAIELETTEESETAETDSESEAESEEPAEETSSDDTEEAAAEEVVNPITECSSLDEINNAVGCKLAAPGVMGVSDKAYKLINCDDYQLAEYDFEVNGNPYCFRASSYLDGDISGVFVDGGSTAFEGEAASDEISYYFGDGEMLSRWFTTDGQYVFYAYAESATSEDSFREMSEELCALTSPWLTEEEYADFYTSLVGVYQDTYSGRASAEVISDGSHGVDISISWANSAEETMEWTMTAQLTEDGLLSYSDCSCEIVTTGEDEGSSEEVYLDGTGYFEVVDGLLYWTGAADENCTSCVFERVG